MGTELSDHRDAMGHRDLDRDGRKNSGCTKTIDCMVITGVGAELIDLSCHSISIKNPLLR